MSKRLTTHPDKESLIKAVPNQYKTLAESVPASSSPFMLAVLKDSVAHARAIEKVIADREKGFTLVVAVENLTEEAAMALKGAGGFPLSLRDFYWTDEGHKNIQQFGGVKEKPREKNS